MLITLRFPHERDTNRVGSVKSVKNYSIYSEKHSFLAFVNHFKANFVCYTYKMRVSGNYRVLLLAALIVSFVPLSAEGAILRTLKIGDRGADVRELQTILNRDIETRIAAIGPGSPGNETEYFGPLTRDAVVRFQRKYALDILAPVSLDAPTGIVGSQTRLFLLRLGSGAKTAVIEGIQSKTSVREKPKIFSVSPEVVTKSTEEVTLTGVNFTTSGNSVLTSSERPDAFVNLFSSDGKTIRFAFHFAAADMLKKQVRAAEDPEALIAAIAENIQLGLNGPRTTRIPITFTVRNINGQSEPARFVVDLPEILKDNGN